MYLWNAQVYLFILCYNSCGLFYLQLGFLQFSSEHFLQLNIRNTSVTTLPAYSNWNKSDNKNISLTWAVSSSCLLFSSSVSTSRCFVLSSSLFNTSALSSAYQFKIYRHTSFTYFIIVTLQLIWTEKVSTWSRSFLKAILLVTSSWARSSFSCSSRILASCSRRFSLCKVILSMIISQFCISR